MRLVFVTIGKTKANVEVQLADVGTIRSGERVWLSIALYTTSPIHFALLLL